MTISSDKVGVKPEASHPVPKTIQCSGTPYEIGLCHGKEATREIHHNIKVYTDYFQFRSKLSWPQAREKSAAVYLPGLRKVYPEILEEMRGIADGAGGLAMEDILTLNTRSELLLTTYSDGCTCISQRTPDGKMFLAQNWDWLEELHHGMVFLHIEPADSDISMHFLSEAGLVGKIGMNSAGVGLTMNAIRASAQDPSKLPVHVAMRRVLQYSSSFDDAVHILESFGVASAVNFMVADSTGRFGDIECSPIRNAVIEASKSPMGSFIAHTNHLYTEAGEGIGQVPAKNSFSRLERMNDLTRSDNQAGVSASFASIRARLSDRQGWPFSICRGGSEIEGPEAMEMHPTVCSGIMELTTKKARFMMGRPDENGPVVEFSV